MGSPPLATLIAFSAAACFAACAAPASLHADRFPSIPFAGLSGPVDVVRLDRGAYPPIDPGLPKVLIVVAHPDDELIAAGATYLLGACAGAVVDVVTITDGQGGFKYATFAERFTGIEFTQEDVGRSRLPAIRREEQARGLSILGARHLIRLGQPDHRYSKDRMEVLAESAGVWDLSFVNRSLDTLLKTEGYGYILTISPTATTHGHHQAATLLAVGAAARVPEPSKPVVLCCQVETKDSEGIGQPPAVLQDALLARLRPGSVPYMVDRTRGFGHNNKISLKAIASVAVAQHLSQGTMLGYIGRGDLEEYWILDASTSQAELRCELLFRLMSKMPDLPQREYGPSAGTNANR